MSPFEACWKTATQPGAILVAVERRLVDAGALIELRQLHGLSASEVDVLLWLETHEPLEDFHKIPPTDQGERAPEARISTGERRKSSQARGGVAA